MTFLGGLGGHAEDDLGEAVVAGGVEEVAEAGHGLGVLGEGLVVHGEGHLRALLAAEVGEDDEGLEAEALLDVGDADELVFHLVEEEDEEDAEGDARGDAGDEDDVRVGAGGLLGGEGGADGVDGGGVLVGLEAGDAGALAEVGGLLDLDGAGALQLLEGHLGADDLGVEGDEAGAEVGGFLDDGLALAFEELELGLAGVEGALGGLDELVAVDLFLAGFELDVRVVLGEAGEHGALVGDGGLPALEGLGDLGGARDALGEGAELGGVLLDDGQGGLELLGHGDLGGQLDGAGVEGGEAGLDVLALAVEALDLAALAEVEELVVKLGEDVLLVVEHGGEPGDGLLGIGLVLVAHEALAGGDVGVGEVGGELGVACGDGDLDEAGAGDQLHLGVLAEDADQLVGGDGAAAVLGAVKVDDALLDGRGVELLAAGVEDLLEGGDVAAVAGALGVDLAGDERAALDGHGVVGLGLPLGGQELEDDEGGEQAQDEEDEDGHPVVGADADDAPHAHRAAADRLVLAVGGAVGAAAHLAVDRGGIGRAGVGGAAGRHLARREALVVEAPPLFRVILGHGSVFLLSSGAHRGRGIHPPMQAQTIKNAHSTAGACNGVPKNEATSVATTPKTDPANTKT